ncbi:MAG: 4-(cytidine 5'-diphospho)-2-C-methyl-D-erythritol kinase [Gammaproteobacteria bacterium]|nr:4-(cytidine 5'-diphospho)-2-C-methyl-D-erythritol kinase [Gammaproteobacteria bacterium]
MKSVKTIFAPAKVNLCLHVLGKRDDGYHDLAMIMQRVSLYDRLNVTLTPGMGVSVDCPGVDLAGDGVNIVEKAASLFFESLGLDQGVSIKIEKHIPAAAGLGGGSSDAAAVLEALHDLLDLNLSRAELISIGARVGADVPFFLYKKTAWVTGVGDRLQPWPGMPPVTLVLVNPGVSVSTRKIFQNLGLTHQRPIARIPRFPVGTSGLVRLLHNDLEVVTCHHHPVITTIKERLIASGAMGALMSGSGATVFGVCADQLQAESVAREIRREADWWVEIVNPI